MSQSFLVLDKQTSQEAALVTLTIDQVDVMIEAFRHILFHDDDKVEAIRTIRKLNRAHVDLTGRKHSDVSSLIDTMNGRA